MVRKFPKIKSTRLSEMSWLVVFFIMTISTSSAIANGFGENSSWQFRTEVDRANLSAVADLVERKKGGYFDGFETVIYSTVSTNIGTQVNCNTIADANANQTDNSQTGNLPQVASEVAITSDTAGNTSSSSSEQSDNLFSEQSNSGSLNASADSNDVLSSTGGVTNGETENSIVNEQSNSGDQMATVEDSVSCNLSGSTLNGEIDLLDQSNTGILN